MGSIAIVGLERDASGGLDPRTAARLATAEIVIVPSATGSAVTLLAAHGIAPVSFATLGIPERAPAARITEALLELARTRDVALAVVGFPFIREGVISGLLARTREGVDVYPVSSPLQVLVLALDIDMTADLEIVDVDSLAEAELNRDTHVIVTGVETPEAAHRVATLLGQRYAPDHLVAAATALDGGGFEFTPHTFASLADIEPVDPGTALYIAPTRIEPPGGFDELVRIIRILRAPGGCPWDREQTHQTLGKHMIEEAYEALAAIEAGDDKALADELGDVLLQVTLHAEIGAEDRSFGIDDVIAGIIAKIRRRHPHIFGDAQASSAEEVSRNWDAIKAAERGGPEVGGVLSGIPSTLPALMLAQKISRRAAGSGFEWEDLDGVWAKVHEEIDELRAVAPGSSEAEAELGDLLFTVVNVARKMGIDSESALRGTCARFVERFRHMEEAAADDGRPLEGLDAGEWDDLWRAAKRRQGEAAGDT